MKPLGATAMSAEASDEQLVALAQAGSSEAFASLFRRYRPAIARYAGRMLGDDARAEDIVQEVFLSALRSIGSLDRPAGFKPWLYRIAHNTCVDHMRRTHRAEEVSIDANLLPASEEIRLFRRAPSTHAAVTQKEDFKNLREAFGGLPPSQSEVLVMRELEGLSYDEIAARMGITRASVESMLFRARQGLRDEYGQIATGERCLRMRPVMARMAEGMGGLRDRRALARHVRGCQILPARRVRDGPRRLGARSAGDGSARRPLPRRGAAAAAVADPPPRRRDRRGARRPAEAAARSRPRRRPRSRSSPPPWGPAPPTTRRRRSTRRSRWWQRSRSSEAAGSWPRKSRTEGDLLLKPDQTTAPARADVGPAVPAGLRPLTAAGAGARRRSPARRPWPAA